MLHILDYEDKIIDFISEDDASIINAKHNRDINNRSETFDFTILSERAINMQKNYRVIIQDSTGQYREFIIEHISQDMDGYTEIETTASYLEDITGAPPYAPGSFEKKTTTEALYDVLKDTGWQVSEATEYGGIRTTSWTGFHTRYDILVQLCTTYDMIVDFYIELGSNTVDGRYVVLRKRNPIFQGKEIVKGKDLTGLKRIVDMSEVNTALLCVGPEKEDGSRITLTVKDDEAQAQFGLPGRYIWGIYEPETEDENMTEARLRSLGTTELNKRKKEKISYEVTSLDIKEYQPHEVVHIGDMVRIKDRDFTPPLYLEAEVIAEDYDMVTKESTYSFGEYKEYREDDLRQEFYKHLSNIRQRMNDNFSNVNTIVRETNSQLQYFEKKIIKSQDAPENPVNDMLWLDTSNPKVAVLRRYWNGQWINATAEKADDIDAVTREKALYDDLNNTFINLNIQHSKLLSEVYEVIDSEYLVDTALQQQVQQNLDNTINVYNAIKTNLESMTPETATIGKLVDTQALFLKYRELLQTLYNSLENAKIAIDDRFKLLQSQYTDEKFNDAMSKVAEGIGGTWNAETGQLLSDIPSQQELEDALKTYINGQDAALKQLIDGEVNSKITQTKNELSSNISVVSAKVDGIQVGGRNLIKNSDKTLINEGKKLILPFALVNESDCYTLSFNAYLGKITDITKPNTIEVTYKLTDMFGERFETFTKIIDVSDIVQPDKTIEERLHLTIDAGGWYGIEDIYIDVSKLRLDPIQVYNFQLEQGNIATAYQKAPEDTENLITTAQTRFNSDIKQLKDSITLKADKTEIKTMYDNNIKPLERQVNDNSAELEIQSDKINSKVSNEQYTADVDDIISKLNSAESQRIQLSNQIADKVSISEYTRGIDSVKSTNRNYIQSYYSSAQNSTSGIAKGPYNVELNASQRINFYFYDRDNSGNPALEQDTDYILNVHESSPEIKVGVFYKKGSYTIVGYTTDKIIRFNTGNREDILIVVLSTTNNQFIGKVSLYKGSKELDWSPAPEDVELLGMTAENNAKSYTDKYKNENEAKLNLINTEIAQNGRDINARATKEEFNASRKTLSKVISDFSMNTTTGLTLSYDENGNITSHTVGPEGIMLKGDRVNINVNKDFQVLAGNVNNKVGKDEIINRLNLSPEGLDINVNNLGIRGGDSTNYLSIKNQEILSRGTFTRTWGGVTDTPSAEIGIKDGYILSRNKKTGYNLYMTEKGLSTMMSGGVGSEQAGALEFHYDLFNDNSRGVRLSSTYGVVFLHSENSRIYTRSRYTTNIETWEASVYIRPQVYSRPGTNEFSFYLKDNDNAKDTDGTLLFGEIYDDKGQAGSGLRFKKAGFSGQTEGEYEPVVYATDKFGNIGTGSFHARNFYGDFQSRSGYLYLKANNRVRITDYKGYNNGNPTYGDLQCRWIQSESIRTTSTNFYIGTSTGEVRVTNNLLYNGGNIGYKPIRAEAFYNSSLVDYKKDIKKWDYDALNVIANELQLYQYKYKKNSIEELNTDEYNHHGLIIGDGYQTPPEFIHKDGVNLYEMVSWSLRAIQQLNDITNEQSEKIKQLEEQINESK
ncbi:hypothetical protein HMPREF2713_08855 [Staphylococcus sp. HMSC059E03]|uniref:phage tail spike protein n=2 Tax=Staphylococcus TaxID=1279 RepID=UPI00076417F1|nr:phage minor structural protein [Staphylococcus simulans]OFM15709.1 hypothetical protein HMPREF2713_08855 [Staphylococcus sp. HMSC059E03]OFN23390.1 hypothetical protein HMPREF2603_09455 [Staphylococcus sp. HMSC055C03]